MAQYIGIDVTRVRTNAQGPEHILGLEVQPDDNPANVYRYVQADDAVAIYDAVILDLAAGGSGSAANVPWLVTPVSAVAQDIVGVAQVAIAAGGYGFVLVKGTGTVRGDGSVAAGDRCVSGAAAGVVTTQVSTATNPSDADHDALAHSGLNIVALADDAGTPVVTTVLIL